MALWCDAVRWPCDVMIMRCDDHAMTAQVLCMEFLEGIKISDLDKIDAAGVDRALLARRTAECYLAQLCRHGFFHCDPHPGTSWMSYEYLTVVVAWYLYSIYTILNLISYYARHGYSLTLTLLRRVWCLFSLLCGLLCGVVSLSCVVSFLSLVWCRSFLCRFSLSLLRSLVHYLDRCRLTV